MRVNVIDSDDGDMIDGMVIDVDNDVIDDVNGSLSLISI